MACVVCILKVLYENWSVCKRISFMTCKPVCSLISFWNQVRYCITILLSFMVSILFFPSRVVFVTQKCVYHNYLFMIFCIMSMHASLLPYFVTFFIPLTTRQTESFLSFDWSYNIDNFQVCSTSFEKLWF